MSEAFAEIQSSPGLQTGAFGDRRDWLAWGGVGAMWLLLIDQLWLEWSTNADYSYGFIVPLLALYLFVLRWQSWQPASPPSPAPAAAAFWVLAFFFLPVRLVQVAQPEWRFVSWGMASIVIVITLGLLWHRGGKRWAWHFAFPVAFMFTAVPWPTVVEGPLTQSLMRADTAFGVHLLNWMGIPALQMGNLVQVGRETVGVSEACSGIRSLQVTWMSALFLGELHRFRFTRRVLLVVFGVAIALLCNLGRTCLLAWLSVSQGSAVMEKWHDSVGLAVLAITLGSLAWFSSAMNPARTNAVEPNPGGSANVAALRPWPRAFMIALAGWLLCVIAGTEIWYRSHELNRPAPSRWSVIWPAGAPGFKEIEIPSRARSFLKYTEGRNASWKRNGEGAWTVFYFRWAPGRTSAALARGHRPEICLPAIGCQLQSEEGTEMFSVNGFNLPLIHTFFTLGGRPLHVWWCLWDEVGQGEASAGDPTSYRSILNAVTRGQRNLGQQVLEVALTGVEDSGAARAELKRMLPGLISQKREPGVVPARQ